MPKTITVPLGGTDYTIPMLNLGQLEDAAVVLSGEPARASFGVLRIALSRATPKVEDVAALEIDADELKSAVEQILTLSGLSTKKKVPDIPNSEAPSAGA
jgi:hypothetical protein